VRPNVLDSLKLDQATRLAKKKAKEGAPEDSIRIYNDILNRFPKNKRALDGIKSLSDGFNSNGSKVKEPPQDQQQRLIKLYQQGQLQQALNSAKKLLLQFPNSLMLYNIQGAVNTGLGQLDSAVDSYKQVLKIKPDYAEAYYNMGNALKNKGDLEAAIDSYKQAVKIKPDYADAFNNMGVVLNDKGDIEAAINVYKQALKIKPDSTDAYYNMGMALKKKGDLESAIESFKKALNIKPDFAEAYYNMGNALTDKGDLEAAIESYKQAITIKPDFAEFYNNMGIALKSKGDLGAAIDSYKQAIKFKPDHAIAYNNMGVALGEKGDLDVAIDSFNQALKFNPESAEAHNNRGGALKDKGKLDSAIVSFKRAIKIKPDFAIAYNNMGVALGEKGDLDVAIDSFNQALKINPESAEVFNNKGGALKDKGKLGSAIDSFKQAINIKPDCFDAFYNWSLCHLMQGNMEKGFNFYESRLKKNKPTATPARANLIWDGEKSLRGKRFVIYEEQGLGDVIQFCRYLPLLEQRGADITFKVKSNLHALLHTMDSKSRLVMSRPEEHEIDFETPLMSLPHLLSTSLETIPAATPYLFAGQEKIQTWGERVSKDRFKIGICWQGNKSNKIDVGRSIPLSLFEGISRIPNVELISLHKGEGEAQIPGIDFDVTTLGHDFDAGQDAFLDTAAVMMNCNLIITSDTAVAHLSGAIGRPTWVVLKQVPDWRWMLDRHDSPWYPTMTLYRQKFLGNWVDVFDTIEWDLRTMLKQKRHQK